MYENSGATMAPLPPLSDFHKKWSSCSNFWQKSSFSGRKSVSLNKSSLMYGAFLDAFQKCHMVISKYSPSNNTIAYEKIYDKIKTIVLGKNSQEEHHHIFHESSNKKSNLHCARLIPFRVSRVNGPSPRFWARVHRPTLYGCNDGESLATCEDLIGSKFERHTSRNRNIRPITCAIKSISNPSVVLHWWCFVNSKTFNFIVR